MHANIRAESQVFWRGNVFLNVLSLMAGCLMTLAFAPFEVRLLAVFSLFILLFLINTADPRQAFIRCYCFGVGMFGLGVSWVFNSLHNYGDSPFIVAGFITVLLVLIVALFLALVGYCQSKFFLISLPVKALIVYPCLWVLHEWMRSWVLSGFPWLLVGYSQIDTVFASYIPVLGVLGTGGVVATAAGALFLLVSAPKRDKFVGVAVLAALMMVGIALSYVQWSHPSGEAIKVAVVQGNIPQPIKLDPQFLELSLNRYLDLSRAHYDSKIIIWPETAVPTFKYYVEPFLSELSDELAANDVALLTGIFHLDQTTQKYYNSLYKVGSENDFYSKQHLVPFGEYMPFRWLLSFLDRFIKIPMSDISAGARPVKLIRLQGIAVGVSICYESAYSDILRDQLPQAQVLVNVSNDAWFGNSFAPHQHLEIMRARALELGRYALRATNTGISAIIAPNGALLARSAQDRQQVISGEIKPYTGQTLFVTVGNYLCVAIALCLLLVAYVRSSRD